MRKPHVKRTILYYLALLTFVLALFFSNDFNLTDVQKTAIVMAVGVDREEDVFIVTSQIALPQSSKQGKQTQTVQLVSRGKTVADALEEINAKTGWYPKLVFCHLILLGEKTVQENVLDALDFFLLDEYLSDNCLVATCEGTAKDLLNVTALVDPSGSVAMQKVLSDHAERVGSVLPSTLREFAIGYYSSAQSAYLPILKTQPQQEQINGESKSQSGKDGKTGESQGTSGESSQNSESSQSTQSGQGSDSKDKPVFSASETALFVKGKMVGKLTKEETFAYNAVKTKLRLATYSVDVDGNASTLSIKNNSPKTKFKIGIDGRAVLKISLELTAGRLDSARALSHKQAKDASDLSLEELQAAEKLLKSEIGQTYEKCRALGCDLFELKDNLFKKENKKFDALQDQILENSMLDVQVRFKNVR